MQLTSHSGEFQIIVIYLQGIEYLCFKEVQILEAQVPIQAHETKNMFPK